MTDDKEQSAAPAGDPPERGHAVAEPRPAAVAFVTTEHFTLQGARSQTISESTGRASIFLASVSGGLIALGLMATAAHVGTAFYVFALILLPTLAFVGLVTFRRTLQTGLEDVGYAQRIARLRGYYFDNAPELTPYLLSVATERRLEVQGLPGGRLQGFLSIASVTAVVTSVLTGATAGLLAAVISKHSLAAALVAGGVSALGAMTALMRYQYAAWKRSVASAEAVRAEPAPACSSALAQLLGTLGTARCTRESRRAPRTLSRGGSVSALQLE